MTPNGPGSAQLSIAALSKLICGNRWRAASSMSGELSTPCTTAPGKRAASTSVELPGPQPRSTTLWASVSGTALTRSRTGRGRSSSKATYCLADHFISHCLYPRALAIMTHAMVQEPPLSRKSAVGNLLGLLEYLSSLRRGASVVQIGDALGLSRSQAHRIVKSLTEEGVLSRHPRSGRVIFGPRMAGIALR